MFSIRLHRARKAAGLSLRDLGERVGVGGNYGRDEEG